jgi:glucose/arabinose dehydrogenase
MDAKGFLVTQLRLFLLTALLASCTTSAPTPTPAVTQPNPTPTTLQPTSTGVESSVPTPAAATSGPAATPEASAPPGATPPAPETIAPPDPACCRLETVVDGFARPVLVTHAGDDRLFIVDQPGVISVLAPGGDPQIFLDIQGVVGDRANEQGLLGLAFHPEYDSTGVFFVNYTDTNGDTVVARYSVSADPNRADPDSETRLFTVDQPYPNHNGGHLAFGPDGLLYIGMGDGGSAGDPLGRAQNPEVLLGKMLRLDVDDPNAQPEIWAMGLRNPWRYSFDRETGDLFIGDVGQGDWEEIDYVAAPLPAAGPNFGWNILEGTHRYSTFGDVAGLTGPVAEYAQSQGGCSVTGGYVYRGQALPALRGNYFFGDYCTGFVWSLTPIENDLWDREMFMRTGVQISSFGEDAAGELYVVDHGGSVLKLVESN